MDRIASNYEHNNNPNILNEMTDKSYLTVRITQLSNELLETSKMVENCTNCKDKIGEYHFDEFYKLINEAECLLDKLDQE